MKKILILIIGVLCLSSCLFNESDIIIIGYERADTLDDKRLFLKQGWFVDIDNVVVNYQDSIITLKMYHKKKIVYNEIGTVIE